MITSVQIGTPLTEIGSGIYGVGYETLSALQAKAIRKAVFVELAGANPEFNRYQPQARVIPLNLMLHSVSKVQRRADFDDLAAALTATGMVPLRWTEDGVTRQVLVTVENFTPDGWFTRAAATLTAPNPDPITI